MDEPHEDHLEVVKQVLMCIVGTSVGVFYPRKKGDMAELMGYSDSNMAGDLDSRKSTSGVLFFFGKSPVSEQ
jgi:hypothetical protein